MENLATMFKTQLPDYVNIEALISRLEDNALEKVHNILQTIFSDTAITILEELAEKKEATSPSKDVQPYYESNLMLFKNRFVMVMQMMVENVFGHTLAKVKPTETKEKKQIKPKNLNDSPNMKPEEKKLPIYLRKTPRSAVTPVKQRKDSTKKPAKEAPYILRPSRTPTRRHSPYRDNSKNVSGIKIENSQVYDSKGELRLVSTKALSITHNQYSPEKSTADLHTASQSAIDRSIPPSPTLNMKRTPSTSSFPQSFSINKQQLLEINPDISDLSSICRRSNKTPTRKNPRSGSRSRLDSHDHIVHEPYFSYNCPSYSIGQAARTCWVDEVARTDSPGPAAHSPKLSRNSPSMPIGKAEKACWIDEVKHVDSPGPAKYSASSRSSSPSPTFAKSPKKCWFDIVARTDSPGPAMYERKSRSSSPNASIGKAKPVFWIDAAVARIDSPGPAEYYPVKHFLSK